MVPVLPSSSSSLSLNSLMMIGSDAPTPPAPITNTNTSWVSIQCPPLPPALQSNIAPSPSASHHLLDFGECTLDSTRTCAVTVTNHSDTPTECTVKFSSLFHTVTVWPLHLTLAARSSALLNIQVQPRQLNPNYRKLIYLTNDNNPANGFAILVRSANILDTYGVRFHSQYYEIRNPFIGALPGLPAGFQEIGGKIKSIGDEDEPDRRKPNSKENKHAIEDDSLADPPLPPVNDDSDHLPPTPPQQTDSNAEAEPHTHPELTILLKRSTPTPPISPPGVDPSTTSGHPVNFPQLQLPTPSTAQASLSATPSIMRGVSDSKVIFNDATAPTNILPLGTLVCHHPVVRVIEVRNITRSRLRLRLATSLDADRPTSCTDIDEMRLYVRNDAYFDHTHQAGAPDQLDSPISDSSAASANIVSPLASAMSASMRNGFNSFPILSPPSISPCVPHLSVPSSSLPSHVAESWSRFMATLLSGEHTALASRFTDLATERSYVKRFIMQRRDLDTVLKERLLIPLHEAQSTADPSTACQRHLTLEPLETKLVFIYINIQSQLSVRHSSPDSCGSPASPASVTFLNKDFTKNKLIRLDEREIRQRDSQTNINNNADTATNTAAATPTTEANAPASTAAATAQPLVTGAASPLQVAPESMDPTPTSDTKPSIAPLLVSLPSDSSPRSDAGLKVFIELVEYPTQTDDVSCHCAEPHLPAERPPTPIATSSTSTSLAPTAATLQTNTSAPLIRASFPCGITPPIRTLLLPAFLCRSALEVAQKHINFGQLLNMNVHSKILVLSNMSEVPLLFMVKQTGSIASLDLTFPKGDIGVIPPQGYTDLPFLFKPSLAGKFVEPITILNVEDTSNTRVINVKAYLRKPAHFWIQNLALEFKICCATPAMTKPADRRRENSLTSPPSVDARTAVVPSSSLAPPTHPPIISSTQRIVVKNISLKARTFKIQLVDWEKRMVRAIQYHTDPPSPQSQSPTCTLTDAGHQSVFHPSSPDAPVDSRDPTLVTYYPGDCPDLLTLPCVPTLTLKLEDVALGASLSLFEREEEEEKLNHKLRIAIRKKKLDKVEKIRNRLSELRDMKMERHSAGSNQSHAHNSSAQEDAANKDDKSHPAEMHDSMEGLTFTLEPNAVQNVRATFTPACHPVEPPAGFDPSSVAPPPSFIEFYTGILHVFETKNKEIIEEVKCGVAIASDVRTQEEYLTEPSRWTTIEEELIEEAEEDTEYESAIDEIPFDQPGATFEQNGSESDAGGHTTTAPTSPQSAQLSSSTLALPTPDLFLRSKSLPIPDENGSPSSDLIMPLLSEADPFGPRSDANLTPPDALAVQAHDSPSVSAVTHSLPPLVAVVPNVATQHIFLSGATSLPSSLLTMLQAASNFPTYTSSKASAATNAIAAQTHTRFYTMLNEAANGQFSLPTATASTSPTPGVVDQRAPIVPPLHDARLPFSTGVPLEFIASKPLRPDQAMLTHLPRRLAHSPRARTADRGSPRTTRRQSTSSSSRDDESTDPDSTSSIFRLLTGTGAAIFRAYIEDQIPLSLPSPSFFTLNSNVPAAMVIEIKWIPQIDESDAMPNMGRSSSITLGSLYGHGHGISLDSTPSHLGGLMRVFVKPGTSLLVPAHTPDPFSPSARPRAASAVHQLPPRTLSLGQVEATNRHYANRSVQASATSPATTPAHAPAASLFVLVPAYGEVDIFMCWLASLAGLSLTSSTSTPTHPRARSKSLRRSASSVSSTAHSTLAIGGAIHEFDASHHHHHATPNTSHRWKKGIAMIDPAVMQEAILMPSKEDTIDDTSDHVPTDSGDVVREPSIGRHSIPGPPRARQTPTRPVSATYSSPPSPSAAAKLPRGQLLIRPVAFPHIRSTLGVEVCSVVGSSTAVSPLMLTPERIHAGVVLVDMDTDPVTPGTATHPHRHTSGIVRGRFVIYNSMTSRAARMGGTTFGGNGKVTVLLGQQTKNTLTSTFVPLTQRAQFTFKPDHAQIPPNDRRVIEFQCRVRTLGYQTHGILVRDVTHDIDMVLPVTFTAKMPTFIHFNDCTSEGEFNVGLIYALLQPHASGSAPALARSASLLQPSPCPPSPASVRFSKLVSFRIENLRDYAVRVEVACNIEAELHVYDGEVDTDLRRCISCAAGRCTARPDSESGSPYDDSTPQVVLPPRSTCTLLLAFSPLLATLIDAGDHRRSFVAGLSFVVYTHHRSTSLDATSATGIGVKSVTRPSITTTPTTVRNARSSSVRFIPEELGETDLTIEYEISDDDDDNERHDLMPSDSDRRSSDDDLEIGSVSGLTLATNPPSHVRLAELHVRVKAMIGISAMHIEPIDSEAQHTNIDFTQTRAPTHAECDLAVLPTRIYHHPHHIFSQPDHRVSTIDFFTVKSDERTNALHPPLRYTLKLNNSSSLLPMCYRLVPSSEHVNVNAAFGCLAPARRESNGTDEEHQSDSSDPPSSTLIELTLDCPIAGLYQEWVSVYVAQQPTIDYRRLHNDCCQGAPDPCDSPHHASETPNPPSIGSAGVRDLLGIREELLHTIFLRCFVKGDRIEVDLPELTLESGVRTHHHQLDLGPVYVTPAHMQHQIDTNGSIARIGSPRPSPPPLPVVNLAPSRKAERHRLLDSILNPIHHSVLAGASLLGDTPTQGYMLVPIDKHRSLSPLMLPNSSRATSGKDADTPQPQPSNKAAMARATNAPANATEPTSASIDAALTDGEQVAISTVVPIHRTFALRNTSQQTQWIWLRSDADAAVQVQWSHLPMVPSSSDDPLDSADICSCGFVPDAGFIAPSIEVQPDGSLVMQYPPQLYRTESLDTISPDYDEPEEMNSRQNLSGMEEPHLLQAPPLYINARVTSTGSLLSDPLSGLQSAPSMSPNDSSRSLKPLSDVGPDLHRDAAFDFKRVDSFEATMLEEQEFTGERIDNPEPDETDEGELLIGSLPSPDYCGEVSSELHGSVCEYHLQSGYENHPDVPHALLLHPCCNSMYQLPPGQQVFAHVTFALDAHQVRSRDEWSQLRSGNRIEWTSLLTVRTQPMSVRDDTAPSPQLAPPMPNSRTSVAIRLTANLVISRSSWQFDAASNPSSSLNTNVVVPDGFTALHAARFTVHLLQLNKLAADGPPLTHMQRLTNRADIPLKIRVRLEDIPTYLTLQTVAPHQAHTPIGDDTSPDPAVEVSTDTRSIELIVPPLSSVAIRFTLDPLQMPIGPFNFRLPIFNPMQPRSGHIVLLCRGEVVAPITASANTS